MLLSRRRWSHHRIVDLHITSANIDDGWLVVSSQALDTDPAIQQTVRLMRTPLREAVSSSHWDAEPVLFTTGAPGLPQQWRSLIALAETHDNLYVPGVFPWAEWVHGRRVAELRQAYRSGAHNRLCAASRFVFVATPDQQAVLCASLHTLETVRVFEVTHDSLLPPPVAVIAWGNDRKKGCRPTLDTLTDLGRHLKAPSHTSGRTTCVYSDKMVLAMHACGSTLCVFVKVTAKWLGRDKPLSIVNAVVPVVLDFDDGVLDQ